MNTTRSSASDRAAIAGAAMQRLALSREHLRQALRDQAEPPSANSGSKRPPASAGGLPPLPGVEALRHLWEGHPLRSVLQLAADAADLAVQPVAQRHPLALVLGAGLAGAALAWSRPWRWIVTPALLAGVLPRMVTRAVGGVSAGTWVALLGRLAREAAQRKALRSHPEGRTPVAVQTLRSGLDGSGTGASP